MWFCFVADSVSPSAFTLLLWSKVDKNSTDFLEHFSRFKSAASRHIGGRSINRSHMSLLHPSLSIPQVDFLYMEHVFLLDFKFVCICTYWTWIIWEMISNFFLWYLTCFIHRKLLYLEIKILLFFPPLVLSLRFAFVLIPIFCVQNFWRLGG